MPAVKYAIYDPVTGDVKAHGTARDEELARQQMVEEMQAQEIFIGYALPGVHRIIAGVAVLISTLI